MEQNTASAFKILSGNDSSNIILVAPHGRIARPRDDVRTAEIAVQMQQRLNCYAVINEKYRKPNAAKSEPAFDLDREICDLNRLDTYRDTPLYEAFVGAIVKFTRQITASGKAPYIFDLHGIRDKNGSKTARRLATALLNMVGEIPVVEPELLEPEILPAVKKDQIDLAVDTILDIYQKAAHEAMFGIGEYLIRTFFKGDYASAVNPRNIKDNSSLRKLHIKLGERTGIKPSKTWVYDSLKVTADKHLLGDMENFRTYGNLSLSHKIRLAYVSELKEKEALIERCSKENWTVRQLEEAIRGPADKTVQPAILKLVVKPEQFVTKYDGDRFRAALKRSKPKQVATLKNKVKKQIREMDQQLEDIRHFKSFYEQLFED
jgi:hypothetical protein